MTETPREADEYWNRLVAARGVGNKGYAVFGGTLRRQFVRRFGNIHSSGVLESLIGPSPILDLGVLGRTMRDDEKARWFLMEISPAYNTWHVEFEGGSSDTNLGRSGRVSGGERSRGPIPRANLGHPSNLVFYDALPIWGGIRHQPDHLLPGAVDVLWQETAVMAEGEPQWQASDTPGDLARIELSCAADRTFKGTVIVDLRLRMCLFYEQRYREKVYLRLVVDAISQDQHRSWTALTEVGETTAAAPPPTSDPGG